jgi:probable rRNA maturation factor
MILNRQRGVRVSLRDLGGFAANASKLLELSADAVTVCLVSKAAIARWNCNYRGKKGPTDVLSFPLGRPCLSGRKRQRRTSHKKPRDSFSYPSGFESPDGYLGDIAIAPSIARRNALRFGRTLEDEMRILILHGMLHLMGYDHETDSGQMDRLEQRLRRTLGLG